MAQSARGESVKVYLDDVRDCPEGWELARTVQEAVDFLRTGKVTHISLDFDLGFDMDETPHYIHPTDQGIVMAGLRRGDYGSGADVARYIRDFHGKIFPLPEIALHTANPVGRKEMEGILQDIKRGLKP